MLKILEKIKNLFSGKFIYKPKKKEEPKPQQEEPKPEERPEEQK